MRKLGLFVRVLAAVAGGLSLPLVAGAAVAVGVNPASLMVEVEVKRQTTVSLRVFNEGDEEAIFDVYADDLSDWFIINPVQFRLSPGQQQLVKVKISALQPGRRQVFLSVTGRALKRQSFNAVAGVKVPVDIVARQTSSYFVSNKKWLMGGLVLLTIFLILSVAVYRRNHRSWWRRARDRFDWLAHHRRPFYYRLLKYLKRW